MEESMTKLVDLGIPLAINLVAAILIYIVGKWLAGVISRGVEKLMIKGKVDVALAGFTRNIIKTVIFIII